MDWIWTDTSLVLDEWSLMEDIYVNIFERKCELTLDEEFPEPRGKAKRRFTKYLLGGAWVALIIGLIWGPLGLFALGRAVGSTNRPNDVRVELEFSGYQPIFRMSATGDNLPKMDRTKWGKMLNANSFSNSAVAQAFFSGYDDVDTVIVNMNGNSTAVWGISPPSQKALIDDLRSSNVTINVKLSWFITRVKKQKQQDMDIMISNERHIALTNKEMQLRATLVDMLSTADYSGDPATLNFIWPNFLRVPEKVSNL